MDKIKKLNNNAGGLCFDLFVCGIVITKESLLKSGARMFLLGGIALIVGLLAGSLIGQ